MDDTTRTNGQHLERRSSDGGHSSPSLSLSTLESSKNIAHRRQIHSCVVCRRRKVKCDRVKPCRACCILGEPENCTYNATDTTRNALSQYEEIARLRREIEQLNERYATSEYPENASSLTRTSSKRQLDYESLEVKDYYGLNLNEEDLADTYSIHVIRAAEPFRLYDGAFVDRMLGRFSPPVRGVRSARGWLRSVVADLSDDSSSLALIIKALSVAYCGIEEGNRPLKVKGVEMYTRVLSKLQMDLNDPEKCIKPETLYASYVASLFELIIKQDFPSWFVHLDGIGKLIEYRGPYQHTVGLQHELLCIYRRSALTMRIVSRKHSFLAQPEWKSIPWSHGYPSKDLHDLIVDIVIDMPTLWQAGDELRTAVTTGKITPDWMTIEKQKLVAQWTSLVAALEGWKTDWALTYPGVAEILRAASADTDADSIPAFDLALSQAAQLYYSSRLLALQTLAQLGTPPLPGIYARLAAQVAAHAEFQIAHCDDFFVAMRVMAGLKIAYYTPALPPPTRARLVKSFDALATMFGRYCAAGLVTDMEEMAGKRALPVPAHVAASVSGIELEVAKVKARARLREESEARKVEEVEEGS